MIKTVNHLEQTEREYLATAEERFQGASAAMTSEAKSQLKRAERDKEDRLRARIFKGAKFAGATAVATTGATLIAAGIEAVEQGTAKNPAIEQLKNPINAPVEQSPDTFVSPQGTKVTFNNKE